MKSFKEFLHGRYGIVYVLAGIYLLVGATLRLVLWWRFGVASQVAPLDLPWVMLAGAVNDAIQATYLSLPLVAYLFLSPDKWLKTRSARLLLFMGCAATLTALLFLSATEYFFFEEFNARFNLVAFDYLMYPTEVIGDIRAEYPLRTVTAVALALSALITWALRGSIRAAATPRVQRVHAWPLLAQSIVAVCAAALLSTDTIAGSIESSLNRGFAHAGNRVADELAANGLSSFFRAARTSEIDYPQFYSTRSTADNWSVLSEQLRASDRQPQGRTLVRHVAGKESGLGRMNVVVIAEESFGAEFSKLYGSESDLTPNFDAYAQQGLWFRHAYASGTRTVRGLEAIAASFPPIPSVSILRRPNNENIATWGGVLSKQGYDTSFLYGGYGYFDNMNYFFGNNGYDVRDRTDIEKVRPVRFANMWGVSDEDLFDYSLDYLDRRGAENKPFFSLIMTTSNHKPFTFREGVPNVPATGGDRPAGVRYADFALGYFLREASKHAWFDNTLFVVVADHGARVYGKADIPLRTYEIPMMIYAPKHVQPRRVDTLVGQIDIAPTVLGMLGVEYDAPFFGTDVLADNCDNPDRIVLFNHNYDVAVYRDGKLAVLGLGKHEQTLAYDRNADSYTRLPEDPKLTGLAVAIYQTAYEEFRAHRYE